MKSLYRLKFITDYVRHNYTDLILISYWLLFLSISIVRIFLYSFVKYELLTNEQSANITIFIDITCTVIRKPGMAKRSLIK